PLPARDPVERSRRKTDVDEALSAARQEDAHPRRERVEARGRRERQVPAEREALLARPAVETAEDESHLLEDRRLVAERLRPEARGVEALRVDDVAARVGERIAGLGAARRLLAARETIPGGLRQQLVPLLARVEA